MHSWPLRGVAPGWIQHMGVPVETGREEGREQAQVTSFLSASSLCRSLPAPGTEIPLLVGQRSTHSPLRSQGPADLGLPGPGAPRPHPPPA